MEPSRVLVLGMGNTLLTDDGAGVAVASMLRHHPAVPAGVQCLDVGTLTFPLISPLLACDALVVVDAVALSLAAGTVQVFVGPDMDALLYHGRRSVHQVGLAELMAAARLLTKPLYWRALVGIQGRCLTWGSDLTPPVAMAVPHAAGVVLSLIRCWRGCS